MSKKKSTPPQATPAAPAAAPGRTGAGRRGLLITGGALVLLAAGGAGLLLKRNDASQRPGLASTHAPTLGDATAKVHIVEFLDPACETCAVFYPLIKRVLADNPGKLRLSVRHVPLHRGSDQVVAMLEASRKQDKYWQALEALLATQNHWVLNHVVQPGAARQVLASLGLNLEHLAADMQAGEVAQRIAQDRQDALALGVEKTPEYFVNGRQMASFGREQLLKLVQDELQSVY
ncbi:MAG: thioredoxin domain-containing protein [Rubrivivax sp.]|nr:thioredoxin domain-containing protein [Rubrivivax sp.]